MIFRRERCVPAHAETDDARGVGVFTDDSNDDGLGTGEDPDDGSAGRSGTLAGIRLPERIGGFGGSPLFIVQQTVDVDGLWQDSRSQRRRRAVLAGAGRRAPKAGQRRSRQQEWGRLLPGDLHPEEVQKHLAVRSVLRVLLRAADVEVELLRGGFTSPAAALPAIG